MTSPFILRMTLSLLENYVVSVFVYCSVICTFVKRVESAVDRINRHSYLRSRQSVNYIFWLGSKDPLHSIKYIITSKGMTTGYSWYKQLPQIKKQLTHKSFPMSYDRLSAGKMKQSSLLPKSKKILRSSKRYRKMKFTNYKSKIFSETILYIILFRSSFV